MFNKIYEKIKAIIKEEYKIIIVYIMILFIGLCPVNYYLLVGGGLIELGDRIVIDEPNLEKGSFNACYVKESHATILTYLLSYVFDYERESIEDSKLNSNENVDDLWDRELLMLNEGNNNAIVNAYKLAGENIVVNNEGLKVISISDLADSNLKIGDLLLKIEDIPIIERNTISNILDNKNYGDNVSILVKRDNKNIICYSKIINLNNNKALGIYLINSLEYNTNRKISLNFTNKEGGSSGGLMLSLAIYNRLVNEDITKGLKIAGTGTIDNNGNIGEIGGVKYKLIGAVKEKADIFLVPSANYEECIKIKNEKKYKIEIKEIKTLKEAVNYLESR